MEVSPYAVLAVMRAARPELRTPADRLAFLVHAVVLAAGHRLVATGPGSSAERTASMDFAGDISHDGWNAVPGEYEFWYLPEGGGGGGVPASAGAAPAEGAVPAYSLALKLLAMGDNLVAYAFTTALAKESAGGRGGIAETCLRTAELNVGQHVDASAVAGGDLARSFKNVSATLADVERFLWGARPAASASAAGITAGAGPSRAPASGGIAGSERGGPALPRVPVYIPPPLPGIGGWAPPPGGPYGIGAEDLAPPGLFPPPFWGGAGGGGVVGPRHPAWGLIDPARPPVPGLPEGARFDPYGPPGFPGFEPGRFGDGAPPRQGRPPVHPDIGAPPEGNDAAAMARFI